MTIHNCKCHKRPYTVCPLCQCEYCPIYWRTCPRCAEILTTARAIDEHREALDRIEAQEQEAAEYGIIDDETGQRLR